MISVSTKSNLLRPVLTLAFVRLFVNMTRRFAYPFLPEISRELGVPLTSVQGTLAVQSGIGVSSPLFGPFSERYGRKRVILSSLSLLSGAGLLGMVVPGRFAVFAGVMALFGLAKWIFDPPMQAYISDRVPYNRRGLAIGITELSWAASLFIIAPITGYLLGSSGLGPVFGLLFILNLIGFGLVWWFVPADSPSHTITELGLTGAWQILRTNPRALAALMFTGALYIANEIILINYSAWLEASFSLKLAELSILPVVIAAAEVIGEVFVTGFLIV